MSKLWGMGAAVALGVAAPASAAVLGPDAPACSAGAGGPAVLAKIDGFKAHTGNVRVQVYGGRAEDFLAKGQYVKRIDLPVSPHGAMEVCVALPEPGNYAVAVRHDIDGSGKSGWNDGGGFSRNPALSLLSLKPRYEDVVIAVGQTPKPVEIMLNYRRGLSIGPVGRGG
ncbi:DUF2141 domain-containing protein [Sphingomonas quercus]|uniref:DUF2141 domain-containing protein n=1 Tax=Sphingomonas quercus TaxID=2842451 RepID=A0ABS6BFQ9_9SPHN|nr:DUF2141 domain-containing protein [Sphingomonas quercus]MBU3077118.1 DUF2141 domain-containing protein [Sphingomonas quercus]